MTYRIVTTIVLLLLAAAAVLLAPGKSLDETTKSVPVAPSQQVTTPAQKSEDDSLKGFKLN